MNSLLATIARFVYCDKTIIEKIIPHFASYQNIENHIMPSQ